MSGPTPRDMPGLLSDIQDRIVALERRRQRDSVDPTDPTPLATETVAGKAQLADEWEAHLWPPSVQPGSNLTSTIMTPQRTMELVEWFAPKVGMARTSSYVADWNAAIEVGFYKGYENSLNRPPGPATSSYLGLVHSGDSADYNSGGSGLIVQDVWEIAFVGGVDVPAGRWVRIRDNNFPATWGAWTEVSGASDWNDITGKPTVFPTDWASVAGKPSTFTPSAHTHPSSQITDFATAVPAAVPAATSALQGKVELATSAEVAAGTDSVRAVTPAALLGRTATEARIGLVELATTTEASAGTDTTRAVTPAGLAAAIASGVPAASETTAGKAELATAAEVQAGTDNTRIVTPAGLSARTATETRTGILRTSTNAEAVAYENQLDDVALTPLDGKAMIDRWTPASSWMGTSVAVADWNTVTRVGFYKGIYNTVNGPTLDPVGNPTYTLGIVHNSSAIEPNGTSYTAIIQEVWEYDYPPTAGISFIIQKYRRIGDYIGATLTWGPWLSEQAEFDRAGTVRWSTAAEVAGGALERTAVTPSDVRTIIDLEVVPASQTVQGIAELATNAEVQAGTDATRIVTPAGLASRTATATRTGLVELATPAEALAGTDAVRAVTPQGLKGVADTKAALSHTHPSSQITDFAAAVDARITAAGSLRVAGTQTDREAMTGMPMGLLFYEIDRRLEWIYDGSWRLVPGQILASMVGPVPNTSGAGVINGVIISTIVLPVGQAVKIIADFSQYNIGAAGISVVRTAWRNSATDVSFATNDGSVTSRAASPSSSAVVSGRGVNALFTTTAAAKVSAAIYTESASSGIYGADGTYLRIESA